MAIPWFLPQRLDYRTTTDTGVERSAHNVLWKELHDLWKSRNDMVHAKNDRYRSQQDTIRATTAIKAFYQYEEEVGAYDKDIFHTPWETRLQQMTPKEVLSWIRIMSPAVTKARKDNLTRSRHGTADIRSFFSPQPDA